MTLHDIFQLIKDNQYLFNTVFGFGTLVSVIVAIITLKQVIIQRQSMYKPEVLIKSFFLSISKNPLFKESSELLLYKVGPFNDYSVNYNDLPFSVSKNYKIENVGFGPAKNIICEWEYDTNSAINMIREILPRNVHFKFINELNLFSLVFEDSNDFYYSANANMQKQEISYISPINVSDHYHLHSIPEIILFTHYLYLIFRKQLTQISSPNFGVFKFDNFPQPKLCLQYYDLNGKNIGKNFNLNLRQLVYKVKKTY